jgi:hypothetical protein
MLRLVGRCAAGCTVLLVLAGSAHAAPQPSGMVVAVIQSSQADGVGGRRALSVQAPVYSGDRILTGSVGETQVRFRDNTRLVVGPNSSMMIDAFVFDAGGSARQVSINAVRGAFRFITGSSNKDAYRITTPTATIGVRGTEFDLSIDEVGATSVAVFSGATRLCDRRTGTCLEQRAGCSVGIVEPGQSPRPLVDQAERQRQLRQNFRYVRSQQSLMSEFRVNTASCQVANVEPRGESPALFVPVVPGAPEPPPPPPPPPSEGNRSGLDDGSNPALNKTAGEGQGPVVGQARSGNQGRDNPSN